MKKYYIFFQYPKSDLNGVINKLLQKMHERHGDPHSSSGQLQYSDFKQVINRLTGGGMSEHEIRTLARHYEVSPAQAQDQRAYTHPDLYR